MTTADRRGLRTFTPTRRIPEAEQKNFHRLWKNLRTRRSGSEEAKAPMLSEMLLKHRRYVPSCVTDRSNRMERMNKAARELLGHCAHLPEEISTAIQENQQAGSPAKRKRHFRPLPVGHSHPAARTNLPAD